MPWKRRQSRWPLVVGLGCLFAVTLFAPGWGRRRQSALVPPRPEVRESSRAAAVVIASEAVAPLSQDEAVPPTLPPLADAQRQQTSAEFLNAPLHAAPSQVAATAIEGAVVESDDYVVVDEPFVEPAISAPVLPPPAVQELPGGPQMLPAETALAASVASPSTSDYPSKANDRSVVIRNVPAPAAPSRPAISLQSLVRVREAMTSALEQLKEQAVAAQAAAQAAAARAIEAAQAAEAAAASAPPVAETAPPANPLRVMVESEHDRLAMIPDLAEPLPRHAAPPATAPYMAMAAPTPVAALAPAALEQQPTALVRRLEELSTSMSPAAVWAEAVRERIDQLTTAPAPSERVIQDSLADLRSLSVNGLSAAMATRDAAVQSAWIRAARALDRRLPAWQLQLDGEVGRNSGDASVQPPSDAALLPTLHEVAALTAGTTEGAAWRQYLRLDDLAGLTSVGGSDYVEARRATARDVLLRMNDPQLTAAQRQFLAQPTLAALAKNLRPWASGVVSLSALVALVEHYELTGSLGDADAIAELRQRMHWSDDPRLQVLADDLNRNYRNANLRVALSVELFSRLVPPQPANTVPVNEKIAGAEVHGRSKTETNVRVRLVPDANLWRLALDVDGVVTSRTYSDVGPARVHNSSRMEYELTKMLTVDASGMHVAPAEVRVDGNSRLLGVNSSVERVPVIGSIVEHVIRERAQESRGPAMAQVKSKVSKQARTRMDREADAKLAELEGRFATGIFAPLERLCLDYQPIDMSTTEERAVIRLRMASEQHLGAHTPRPSAPSDSLVSLQLHESALNNAARGMNLDGRRVTVGELHALLAEKFTQRSTEAPADLPKKAVVEFAAHDAVRIQCHDDCVELSMHIIELKKGRDSIRNVCVHAFFKPVLDGLELKLVRDGNLQFEGAHLRTGTRLVLHSVFGKMIRKDQEIPVLVKRFDEDPRFAGLMITQLVIDDGWLALSVGPVLPNRTAWRTRCEAMTR